MRRQTSLVAIAEEDAAEIGPQQSRHHVPLLTDDRYFAPDMEHATFLVFGGALADAAGRDALPTLL